MDANSLVRSFTLRSLPIVILLAIALGLVVTFGLTRVFLHEAGHRAETTVNALVRHHLADLDIGTTASSLAWGDLDELVSNDLAGGDIYALRVWNTSDKVVYSSFTDRGAFRPDAAALERVMDGESVQTVARAKSSWPDRGIRVGDRFILVLSPLKADDGRVVGVLEIHQSYHDVYANSMRAHAWIWAVILIGVIPAFGLQVRIVRRAAEQLGESEQAVQNLDARLTRSMADLERHSLGTLQALNAAVDAKDSYTARHSISVTDYAVAIGRRMGLGAEDLRILERAGLLHDVGKIGVPERILLKPAGLTAEESEVIKDHSEVGARIIGSIPFLEPIVPVVRHHHERWNGSGYPKGLVGQAIPPLARVLAVADAFDAMTSDRPYRAALSLQEACAELHVMRGIQFEPVVVDALLDAVDDGDLPLCAPVTAASRETADIA